LLWRNEVTRRSVYIGEQSKGLPAMRAHRTLPVFPVAALLAGVSSAAWAQAGWQDQRTIALQSPGHSMSMLRQLDRNHDEGFRTSGNELQLGHGVTVRNGKAYLFQAQSDDFPLARFSGMVDGKGFHLVMSWPP
jgi:hypothetical protein